MNWDSETVERAVQNFREILGDGDSLRCCDIGKAEDGRKYSALIMVIPGEMAGEAMSKLGPYKALSDALLGLRLTSLPLSDLPPATPTPVTLSLREDRNALTKEEMIELGLL